MIVEVVKIIFEVILAGFKFGEKVAPTDEMKEKKLEIKTKRLEYKEYQKVLKSLRAWLVLHPRQSVDAVVDLKCDNYDQDDIADFKKALYEMFPKRKHSKF